VTFLLKKICKTIKNTSLIHRKQNIVLGPPFWIWSLIAILFQPTFLKCLLSWFW